MENIWEQIKNQIRTELPEKVFSLWINPITFKEQKDDTITLSCPNKFLHNWATDNYLALIRKKFLEARLGQVDVNLTVTPLQRKPSIPVIIQNEMQRTFTNFQDPNRGRIRFNSNFTFNNFVVGKSNEFAYSASMALADINSRNFHTLLLHANTGLGKSHLSHAVGHSILEKNPQSRVVYLTAENFFNEMVFAMKNNNTDQFKDKYRKSCDVLLLEEIHFLSGKEKTQCELAYTLDALANENKKIIFTSSLAPKDIPKISKSLSSRFTSGLVSSLEVPDYETRVKILHKKAAALDLSLSRDIIHYIATHIKRDIRNLESALKSLKAKSELLKIEINLDLAKKVTKHFVSENISITHQEIQNVVCEYYKVPQEILTSKSRKKEHTYPRNIYIYLCRKHTDETLENIARTLNRSHSSVLYATELIEKQITTDAKVKNQIEFLSSKLK